MAGKPGSFGAGLAGAALDPVSFIKEPRTILRVLSWVFSMVVFASIINEGYVNQGSERLHCVFNKNYDACNYGVVIATVAFLASVALLLMDVLFPQISSVRDRRRLVLLELCFSGLWAFLWFVCFCFLASQWSQTSPEELPLAQASDAARAAIAFSFFSILTWTALTLLALQSFLQGTDLSLFSVPIPPPSDRTGQSKQPSTSPTDPIGQTTLTINDYKTPPLVIQTTETRPPDYHGPAPAF
ncbi:synaptogyrin-3-like [Engraulis encrasicolus]|uniref:synaptogyrin-3-like n=1 Tax=Engraulis encrasicolus TaxID=184585 RepID=UPI002FD1FDC6